MTSTDLNATEAGVAEAFEKLDVKRRRERLRAV
jgi:hypothetical protein